MGEEVGGILDFMSYALVKAMGSFPTARGAFVSLFFWEFAKIRGTSYGPTIGRSSPGVLRDHMVGACAAAGLRVSGWVVPSRHAAHVYAVARTQICMKR